MGGVDFGVLPHGSKHGDLHRHERTAQCPREPLPSVRAASPRQHAADGARIMGCDALSCIAMDGAVDRHV